MVHAGWVISMDPAAEDGVITDGAVVIRDDEIVGVGPWEKIRGAHPRAVAEEMPGHVLMPGMVNTHTHLAMTMFRGIADDRPLEEFLERVIPLEARNLDPDRVRTATRAAVVESHLCGVTTALDMYFFCDSVLEAAAEAGGRVLTGPVVLDAPGPDLPGTDPQKRLELAAEFLAEHPPTDRWRPVLGPHATYTVSPEHLRDAGALARSTGALLHIHASETAAEIRMVEEAHGHSPVRLLAELGVLEADVVIAHGVHLEDSEIELLTSTGTSVAHCPASNLKLASGVASVRRLAEAGVNVSLGTDGPASSNDLDLLAAVRLAALLHKSAAPEGPDARFLAAPTALGMATRHGAVAVGLGERLGVLRVGSLADMVAVDLERPFTQPVHDPCSAVVYAAARDAITDVWCEGRRVVSGGRHQLVDESQVVAELSELGSSLRS